jgi:hypothetical protein
MSKKKPIKNITSKTEEITESKKIQTVVEKKTVQPPELNKKPGLSMLNLLLIAAGLLILTFIAYQPALDNDFVDWDDNVYVIDNPMVRNEKVPVSQIFKQPVSLNYHPITMLSMRWNSNECKDCVYGISAKPFITWNLILHLLNTFLVLLLAFRLSKQNVFVGVFTAAVFALHPMHVESVAWVSERKDVLYVFFFLLGLLAYDRYLEIRNAEAQKIDLKWIGLALVSFVLACLSKAMAVVFPLVMILMNFWRNSNEKPIKALIESFQPKKLLEYVPFFAVAIFFGLMAMDVQSGGDFGGMLDKRGQEVAVNKFDTFTILQRLHFAAYGFCMYIFKFFVPTTLCTFHPYPTQAEYDSNSIFWGLFVLAIVIAGLTVFSLFKTKIAAFGIGFYLFTVAFVLQFISVGVVIMADRYSYLPYFGLAFMLAMFVEQYLPKNIKTGVYGLAAVACIAWLVQTRIQVDTWQNSEKLWGTVIGYFPNEEQPYSIRGNYYGKMASFAASKGDANGQKTYMDKAAADFQKAIQLNSKRADVFEGMGNIHGMRGEHPKALEMYNKAILYNPAKATAFVNRGIAYSLLGDQKASLNDMDTAVKLDPKPTHLLYRGIGRQTLGDNVGARADYEAVLKQEPGNKMATERLGSIK